MGAALATPSLLLPWESSQQEDALYRRIQRLMLLLFMVVAVAIPVLPVAELTPEEAEEVPAHLARILLEKKELPKPEPVKPKVEKKPPPKPREVPPVKTVQEPVKSVNKVEQAREQAKAAGVLAFQDELMDMRDSLDVADLDQTQTSRGETSSARVERSLITANNTGSGGIQTSAISRNAGGPALSAREATRVESNITAGTGTRESKNASEHQGGRSDESIRRVMDRSKGAIFSVYNRALRKDPLLEGKVVFEMVIEPSGEVSDLRLISSELQDEELTRKILARIRMIRFDAASVLTTRVNYSFDFLPYG
ncbi:AgmX/PglI C-terminal domain-containing protein [Pseudohalioglobus lutimaris]|uniref:Energy transducer TonB n=1 Tax=Pseudohalioglobus lutimaris TaxID=1737061 RepID=A0A2N5X0N7_9GAMM|nr:AgmX/PglI C-terminal domain-containing protein [Pseudohalioglobus lutimaris]PLW68065.1 energy transducer TonB [Pseudohalioglobus lutimaris]